MMRHHRLAFAVVSLVFSGTDASEEAAANPFEMSAELGGWKRGAVASGSEEVELSFWVKQTHLDKLKHVVDSVSDPQSPNYGHYLSKQEVDALTAPTERDVKVVEDALHPYKIRHVGGSSIVSATVPVSFAERLLGGAFVHFCRDKSCVLRNPSATVPPSIAAACDIITPLNDPLPPRFHGPIIEPPRTTHATSATLLAQPVEQSWHNPSDTTPNIAGCCFAYGYGAMMKPCCLSAQSVAGKDACKVGQRLGGSTNFHEGECPATAEEAAALVHAKQQHHAGIRPAPALTIGAPPSSASGAGRVQNVAETEQGSGLPLALAGFFAAALVVGAVAFFLRRGRHGRNAPLLEGPE